MNWTTNSRATSWRCSNSTKSPGLVSVSEICLGIGDALAVTDAIDRLHKFGVIHRCGEFVLMTRAAARTLQLAER